MAKKWFINLSEKLPRGKSTNHGPKIPLVAKRKFGHGRSAVGGRIAEWAVVVTPDTHDTWVAPASFESGVETPERDSKFTNALVPPPVGGRTYRVTAKKKANQGANNITLNEEYVAWRRLYYTLNWMNADCKKLFNDAIGEVKTIYEGLHISLKEVASLEAVGGNEVVSKPRKGNEHLQSKHTPKTLERSPTHLRFVAVNDLASDHYKSLKVATTGTDDPDLAYAAGKLTVNTHLTPGVLTRNFKLEKLEVTPYGVPVAIDPEAITLSSQFTRSVDLTHVSVVPFKAALDNSKTVVIKGKFRGSKAPGNLEKQLPDTVANVLTAHTAERPLVVDGNGSARLWVADRRLHVAVTKENYVLQSTPAAKCKVKPGALPVREVSELRRDSDTQFSFALDATEVERLAAGDALNVKFEQWLLRKEVLEAEAEHPFEVKLSSTGSTEASGIGFKVESNRLLVIEPKSILMPADATLTDLTMSAHGITTKLTSRVAEADLVKWVVNGEGENVIELNLGHGDLALSKAALDAGRRIDLVADYSYTESFGGGYAKDTNVVLLTCIRLSEREDYAVTKKRMVQILLHEIAHALNVTRKEETNAAGTIVPNRSWYDDAHGGTGPHCRHNTKEVDSPLTTSKKICRPNDTTGKVCNMYHTMAYLDRMNGTFCDVCRGHLLRNAVVLPQ